MSALSEQVRKAIKTALAGTAATTVYHDEAAPNAVYPYIVFNRQGPGTILYALAGNNVGEDDLWLINCTSDEETDATKSPIEINEAILQDALSQLGTSLTLSGGVTRIVRKISDVPRRKETVVNKSVFTDGFLLRVFAE
jgi:hypothetical protein